ncbi:MAG: flavin reductase [Candidatus Omnitrophica bacterium]|nr:flavin reductase [Candidatus Omnitrophota bacterium]MDD5574549.1 flavin reductase [Candidatus Omnitrophota bacterium]
MAGRLKAVKPELLKDNPFQAIGKEWMLISAGTSEYHNMMTASWGAWGVLWHKPVCFCFIRPHRYTFEFMERKPFYTLNFFDKKFKKALQLCGSKSGRDIDKVKAAGLTACRDRTGAVYFAEARLVIVCRKIYFQDIEPRHFLDPSIEENYPKKDYHRMYAGEVVRCLAR